MKDETFIKEMAVGRLGVLRASGRPVLVRAVHHYLVWLYYVPVGEDLLGADNRLLFGSADLQAVARYIHLHQLVLVNPQCAGLGDLVSFANTIGGIV